MAEIHFSPDEPVIVLDVTIKGPKGKRKIPTKRGLELLLPVGLSMPL